MLDLNAIMTELANERYNEGIFTSEADFQFQLGWKIKEKHPDYFIMFEVPHNNTRIDIVVEKSNGERIPIELKYFTKPIEGYDFLRDQKNTWRVYDYLKDVERNENYLSEENEHVGYAILLTNRNIYWNGPLKRPVYYNFRLNQNRTIKAGPLKWGDLEQARRTLRRSVDNINLRKNYVLNWKEYKTVSGSLFKYLLIETKL